MLRGFKFRFGRSAAAHRASLGSAAAVVRRVMSSSGGKGAPGDAEPFVAPYDVDEAGNPFADLASRWQSVPTSVVGEDRASSAAASDGHVTSGSRARRERRARAHP